MPSNRRSIPIVTTFLLLAAHSSVWAHRGVRHDHGPEQHARIQVVEVGPGDVFRLTVAHLPDRPIAGQEMQFLIRLEEKLDVVDPLLGGHAPLVPQVLDATFEDRLSTRIQSVELQEAKEAGVYQFRHVFLHPGSWTLVLEFENAARIQGRADIAIPVRSPPINWTLWMLQGIVVLGGVGLIIHRFKKSEEGSPLLSSGFIGVLVLGAFVALYAVWPSSAPSVGGVLEIGAVSAADSSSSPPDSLLSQTMSARPAPVILVGTVSYAPDHVAWVRSPFPGTIVYPDETPTIGDRVRSGQVLAKIENRYNLHDYVHLFPRRWELSKEVLRLQDRQVQAETAFARAAQLLEFGTISRREFDKNEFEYVQASMALKKAQQRLSLHDDQIRQNSLKETLISSPIAGQLTRAIYTAGQMVYEGAPLFEVVDSSVVWLRASVFPEDIHLVRSRFEVRLASPIDPGRKFRGKLINIQPEVEPQSKTIQAVYSVSNTDLWLRRGMVLNVYLDEDVPAAP